MSILGKKVYFVHPNSVVRSELVIELIRDEYEVYLVKDEDKAIGLFHRHPDSVAFLNIDDGRSEPEWEQYVRSLQEEEDLQPLQIGILTYNADPELAQKYLMNLMVPAGFVKLSLGLKESTETIRRVLEVNEARGRRRYLRVQCTEGSCSLNYHQGQVDFGGTILDLSSAGMACRLTPEPQMVKNSVLEGIQLKLKGVLCLVSGVVVGTRPDGESLVYVVLFTNRTNPESKDKIRTFLAWTLQSQVEAEVEALG